MLNITREEVAIDETLRKKLEFICEFAHTKPLITNGFIHKIDKTNLFYVEPNKVIINGVTFLIFNYSDDVYIKNLYKKIKLSELEQYIKETNI